MSKRLKVIIFLCLLLIPINLIPSVNYKSEMTKLVSEIYSYSKSKNKKFNVIINGGYGLYSRKSPYRHYILSSVDAVLVEEVSDKKMISSLNYAKSKGLPVFTLEYGKKHKKVGYISYRSPTIELDSIPNIKGNTRDITDLHQVKNYLALLNPHKYKTKKSYLSALRNTNYDLIIIDAFYNKKILTKAEVASLKRKKNGSKRLVCTYVSVGEAEDYRYYFKKSWKKKHPKWLKSENKSWHGNYKVKYWDPKWKRIVNSYLDKVLSAGFDGAYFDVIDAYEYFESK